jgi:UDP-glucose 4-epimerase
VQPEGDRPLRALVTGGSGFVGSHLADALLSEGIEVYALDDLSTGSIENIRHLDGRPDFHFIAGSVLSEAIVSELVLKCDQVYHLAAAVGVRLIVEKPVHTLLTNIRGTENVLECCARFEKPVFLASTSEVYGDHRVPDALGEDSRRIYGPTTSRRWAYADSKALDELLALAYRDELGLQCVIGRLFNTVGPRQTGEYGMVVPRFIAAALKGDPIEVFGDGHQTRCFCHVYDTVDAIQRLMSGDHFGSIFNIGDTTSITILELANTIKVATGSRSRVDFIPHDQAFGRGIEDMLHRKPDIGKISEATGWAPSRTLDDVIADVIRYQTALV